MSNLEEHIERPLRRSLRQTGHPAHLCDIKEILEIVGLIDKQPVDSKFFKGQGIVLLVLGGKELKARF